MKDSLKPTEFGRTQRFDAEWLARAEPEPALEPDLPIIDTHMHLWQRPAGYRYFVEEFAEDVASSGHNIEATVFVECKSMYRATGPDYLRCVGETEFAAGQAAIAASETYTRTRVAAGIVAYADLAMGDRLDDLLDAHLAAANGRLRGVRQLAKWDADPVVKAAVSTDRSGVLLEPAFRAGLSRLATRDLLFEASIYHPQLSEVAKLARQVSEARIVVIHSGSPLGYGSYATRGKEVHAAWLADMKELARCPNVSLKLGGLVMTLASFDFGQAPRPINSTELAELWRPYIEPCVELFGAERCMLSSNFPVDKAAFPYGTVWNMFKRIFAGCSAAERAMLFHDTAKETYRI